MLIIMNKDIIIVIYKGKMISFTIFNKNFSLYFNKVNYLNNEAAS